MKNFLKRFITALIAAVMCFSMSVSAFADEPESLNTFSSSTEDEAIMPRSISGYNRKTITATDNIIYISCNGSGGLFSTGMGITIKTTSSDGVSYLVGFGGGASTGCGSASMISGTIYTSTERQFHNLNQNGCSQYFIAFEVPSYCSPFLVEVWIYG